MFDKVLTEVFYKLIGLLVSWAYYIIYIKFHILFFFALSFENFCFSLPPQKEATEVVSIEKNKSQVTSLPFRAFLGGFKQSQSLT